MSKGVILLVDTDLLDKYECIRNKYEMYNNIMVVNHYEFQEYVISKYYEDDSI
jgi:hypothetical protein